MNFARMRLPPPEFAMIFRCWQPDILALHGTQDDFLRSAVHDLTPQARAAVCLYVREVLSADLSGAELTGILRRARMRWFMPRAANARSFFERLLNALEAAL